MISLTPWQVRELTKYGYFSNYSDRATLAAGWERIVTTTLATDWRLILLKVSLKGTSYPDKVYFEHWNERGLMFTFTVRESNLEPEVYDYVERFLKLILRNVDAAPVTTEVSYFWFEYHKGGEEAVRKILGG